MSWWTCYSLNLSRLHHHWHLYIPVLHLQIILHYPRYQSNPNFRTYSTSLATFTLQSPGPSIMSLDSSASTSPTSWPSGGWLRICGHGQGRSCSTGYILSSSATSSWCSRITWTGHSRHDLEIGMSPSLTVLVSEPLSDDSVSLDGSELESFASVPVVNETLFECKVQYL